MSLLMFLLLWLFMLASLLVLVAVVIASVLVIVALHNRRIFLMFGLRLSVGSTCHRCCTSINRWPVMYFRNQRVTVSSSYRDFKTKKKKHIQYISHHTWLQDPPRNWCKSLDEKRLITRKSSRRSHIQQAMSWYRAIWVSGKWLIV